MQSRKKKTDKNGGLTEILPGVICVVFDASIRDAHPSSDSPFRPPFLKFSFSLLFRLAAAAAAAHTGSLEKAVVVVASQNHLNIHGLGFFLFVKSLFLASISLSHTRRI